MIDANRDQRRERLPVRAQRLLANAMLALAGLALLGMMALVSVHVGMRAIFGTGIRGTEELSKYLMIFVVYAGLAATLRDGGFIRMDLVLRRLPPRVRRVVERSMRFVSLVFLVVLTWFTSTLAWSSWQQGTESIGVLRTPLWIPQSVMALGCAVISVQVFVLLLIPREGRDTSAIEEAESEMREVVADVDIEKPAVPRI